MDSDQLIGFTDSFNFEKNVFIFLFVLMYSYLAVQKLPVYAVALLLPIHS